MIAALGVGIAKADEKLVGKHNNTRKMDAPVCHRRLAKAVGRRAGNIVPDPERY
jgi:hypothetical protein